MYFFGRQPIKQSLRRIGGAPSHRDPCAAIEDFLPNGSLYDYGRAAALKRAGTNLVGTADIRNLANVLRLGEAAETRRDQGKASALRSLNRTAREGS